jgi:hypothetical protein
MLPEMAYAQRAAVNGAGLPSDVVWLNANEYPGGIPDVSLAAMLEALPGAFRYHYQEFGAISPPSPRARTLRPSRSSPAAGRARCCTPPWTPSLRPPAR